MDIPEVVECISLKPGYEQALARFFSDLAAVGDDEFFQPHAGDIATLHALAARHGQDIYTIFVAGKSVYAYGLLRGWDDGYVIPSLGVAVHPDRRTNGLGRLMMEYLEAMARYRNASAVRLRVHKSNARAIELYEHRGYSMSPDVTETNLLVGVKRLGVQA